MQKKVNHKLVYIRRSMARRLKEAIITSEVRFSVLEELEKPGNVQQKLPS